MKILKVVVFIALVLYWIGTMNAKVKGEGLWGSFLGIVILVVFVYVAYDLFFNSSKQKNNQLTKSGNPKLNDNIETNNARDYAEYGAKSFQHPYNSANFSKSINAIAKIGLHSYVHEQLYSLAMEAVKESTINEKGMLMTYASHVVELLGNQSIETLIEIKSELKLSENDIEELVQEVAEEVRDRIVDEIKTWKL